MAAAEDKEESKKGIVDQMENKELDMVPPPPPPPPPVWKEKPQLNVKMLQNGRVRS